MKTLLIILVICLYICESVKKRNNLSLKSFLETKQDLFSFCSFSLPVRIGEYVLSCFHRVRLFLTPWTVAHWVLLMGFSRQEYWTGWPCPPPGDLPDPGTEPASPATLELQADFFIFYFFTTESLGKESTENIRQGERRTEHIAGF